jgi:hypothetical protein
MAFEIEATTEARRFTASNVPVIINENELFVIEMLQNLYLSVDAWLQAMLICVLDALEDVKVPIQVLKRLIIRLLIGGIGRQHTSKHALQVALAVELGSEWCQARVD